MRYERDSVVVGIVGMCITGYLMELWVLLTRKKLGKQEQVW